MAVFALEAESNYFRAVVFKEGMEAGLCTKNEWPKKQEYLDIVLDTILSKKEKIDKNF